ncbi:hypothetical protein Tco_1269879 [Tanacetum coccineum]
MLVWTSNTKHLNPFSKLEYKVTWWRILKEWKELTTSRIPEKVLVREEARQPITRHVNAISLVKMKKEKSVENNEVVDKNNVELNELDIVEPIELVDMEE